MDLKEELALSGVDQPGLAYAGFEVCWWQALFVFCGGTVADDLGDPVHGAFDFDEAAFFFGRLGDQSHTATADGAMRDKHHVWLRRQVSGRARNARAIQENEARLEPPDSTLTT